MKLYAVKDRLMDYFMTPFAAHEDKQVMAQLAETINNGGNNGIQQAPHHFELWGLGEVSEDGHLTAERRFIADCGALIRPRREPAELSTQEAGRHLADRKEPPGRSGKPGHPQGGAVPETAPAEAGTAETAYRDGYRGHQGGESIGAYPFARDTN